MGPAADLCERYTSRPPMAKFRQHIFVCENARPDDDPRGGCANKGSTAIREALKDECNKRGLKGIVRVNKAGCLDQCHVGPVVVVYPEQTWYGGVRPEDVTKVADAVAAGEIVHSLVVPDEHLTGKHQSGNHQGNMPGGF